MALNLEKQLEFVSDLIVSVTMHTDSNVVRLVPSQSRERPWCSTCYKIPDKDQTQINKAVHIICVPLLLGTGFLFVGTERPLSYHSHAKIIRVAVHEYTFTHTFT